MNILGVSCHFHDAAAALVVDGAVAAAAAEERFSRRKHDSGLPHQAIRFCLDQGGLLASELDAVVFYEKPLVKLDRIITSQFASYPGSLPSFLDSMPVWLRGKLQIGRDLGEALYSGAPVLFSEHHEAHAASAFFTSPFERAAILTVDGVGEWCTTAIGIGEGAAIRLDDEIRFPHSLGLFYSALTDYLGFRVNGGEWKVMALGAFGEPRYLDRLRRVVRTRQDGSYRFDMAYFGHHRDPGVLFTKPFERLVGFPPRRDGEPLIQEHYDLARSGQLLFEEILEDIFLYLHHRYDTENLCLAGGAALNSLANGRLFERGPFRKIYVPPAPGDDGGAVGAALLAWYALNEGARRCAPPSPYLGPRYDAQEIERLTRIDGQATVELAEDALIERAVDLLLAGRIVGWFQGAMEFGPRALGNRSILAAPGDPGIKERLNRDIKRREPFRPFSPAVLAERAGEFFCTSPDSPFMSFTAQVLSDRAHQIPAVLHADGSARLQTVERDSNPRFRRLIQGFAERSSLPILLNTSLNVAGEPIVCSPRDALITARRAGLDDLFLGRHWVPLTRKRSAEPYAAVGA